MSDVNKLLGLNMLLCICLVLLGVAYHIQANSGGYFAQVPVDKIHTMKVWEDGSFEIVYINNTSEVGCLPEGLCND